MILAMSMQVQVYRDLKVMTSGQVILSQYK